MDKIKLFSTRNFEQNLSVSLNFMKQNYVAICKLLIYFIPVYVVIAFLQPNLKDVMLQDITSFVFNYEIILGYLLSYLTSNCISVIVISYLAVYSQADGEVDLKLVWSLVEKKILAVFALGIIFTICVILGCILLIIPGIILAVYWCFSIYVYIIEDCGIIDSLKRSYQLVKGNWKTTFLYITLFSVIVYIISAVFSLPYSIASIGIIFGIDFLSDSSYQFIALSISYVGQLFVMPILLIGCGIYYFSLRDKNENIELSSVIERIGE